MFLFRDEETTHLDELEGLTDFFDNPIKAPTAMTLAEYEAVPSEDRYRYDTQRIKYASGGILISTPQTNEAIRRTKSLMSVNVAADTGLSGLLIEGESTSGKTTTCKAIMRRIHSLWLKQFPDYRDYGRVPIVYIEVPSSSTGKNLMRAFARFFNLSYGENENADRLLERVVAVMRRTRVQLVIVDELQNMIGASTGNAETLNLLKSLHNRIRATFIYAGIDIIGSPLLTGPKSKQIMGRFSNHTMDNVTLGVEDRQLWKKLVGAFEDALPLFAMQRGDLRSIAADLYDLTGGSLGSLGKLLTSSAIDLILEEKPEDERLHLDALRVHQTDMNAQAARIAAAHRQARTASLSRKTAAEAKKLATRESVHAITA